MKILKILILFILLFIMESCNNKKVDVKKIDFSISNEKMKHSNNEEIFQKLLFNIDINKYRETDISTIGFFCLVNLKTNEIITEDLEQYLSIQNEDIYIGIYTMLDPEKELVKIDGITQFYYNYFTIININKTKRVLITFWKFNPKNNYKFEYFFNKQTINKKILLEKKNGIGYTITRS